MSHSALEQGRLNTRFKAENAAGTPWSTRPLGTLCSTGSGTTPSRASAARYYHGGAFNWVKTLDLNNSEIFDTEEKVTATALHETSLRVYPPGTVLIAMYGGFKQIGRTGILRCPAAVNQALLAIEQSPDLVPEFVLTYLNYRVGYWRSVASSSRKDPNISSWDVKSFPIKYPPPSEQSAIATALSDVDGLIASLDRLIAKKRAIKQAAMQQLLTGKTRLPGFKGKWVKPRLGEVARITMGRTPSRAVGRFWGPGHRWMAISDLHGRTIRDTAEQITAAGAAGIEIIPAKTLVMSFKLSIGRVAFTGSDMYSNEAICALRGLQIDPLFTYYALQRVDFSLYGKQAVKGYTLNKQSLRTVEVYSPSDLNEQKAIGTALESIDDGIEAVERRRDKAKSIRQGMMQSLLTGRVRLQVEPTAGGKA